MYAVVAVGRIRERPPLVDDADGRLVSSYANAFYLVYSIFHQRVKLHGAFHCRLRVELRRIGDLEQHVLHHVAAERALELELLALEEHVVEAPGLGSERRRVTHFAGLGDEREPYRPRSSVARGPAFARAGVRRMAVGA